MSWINSLIAVISLVVSIIALVLSLRAQGKANASQKRIVEIEEHRDEQKRRESQQASLRAELRGTEGSERLYIVNLGAAEARNVRVILDGKPLEEHCAIVGGDSLASLVGGGAEVSCLLAIYQTCAPPFECEVRWDDDSRKDRLYRTTLTW